MFDVVLYEPEIPSNTGNIIRLCANTGARLHLVEPLGFEMDDRRLRRAGLDYHEFASVKSHPNLQACLATLRSERLFAFSTKGQRCYAELDFGADDVLLFGPETRGLPQALLNGLSPERICSLPMRPGSRSLNLSNAIAAVLFEGWRQCGFKGALRPGRVC